MVLQSAYENKHVQYNALHVDRLFTTTREGFSTGYWKPNVTVCDYTSQTNWNYGWWYRIGNLVWFSAGLAIDTVSYPNNAFSFDLPFPVATIKGPFGYDYPALPTFYVNTPFSGFSGSITAGALALVTGADLSYVNLFTGHPVNQGGEHDYIYGSDLTEFGTFIVSGCYITGDAFPLPENGDIMNLWDSGFGQT